MTDATSASVDPGAIRVAVSASALEPHHPEGAAADWVGPLRRALERHFTLVPVDADSTAPTADDALHGIAEPAGWIIAQGGSRQPRTSRVRSIVPFEDAAGLRDPVRRGQFILRVRVHHRWQRLQAAGLTRRGLVAFQTEHKYLALAHSPEHARRLGRLAAEAGRRGVDAVADDYASELMAALAEPADRRGHYNALQHAAGHLRGRLNDAERAQLHHAIDRFAAGEAALAEPMSRLRDLARERGSDWLAHQRYLDDGPLADPGPH